MKPGDLVRIYNTWFEPGESDLAVYLHDGLPRPPEWREIHLHHDCTILLNGRVVPFNSKDLRLVEDEPT